MKSGSYRRRAKPKDRILGMRSGTVQPADTFVGLSELCEGVMCYELGIRET
jgi:hypothetical protein